MVPVSVSFRPVLILAKPFVPSLFIQQDAKQSIPASCPAACQKEICLGEASSSNVLHLGKFYLSPKHTQQWTYCIWLLSRAEPSRSAWGETNLEAEERPGDLTPSLFDSTILVQLPSSTFSSDKWRTTAVITPHLRIASLAESHRSSNNNDNDNDDNNSYRFLYGRYRAKSDLCIVAHAIPIITWEEVLWLSPVYKLNGESLNVALSTRAKRHLVGHRATGVEASPPPVKNSLIWQIKQELTNKAIMPQGPASASKGIATALTDPNIPLARKIQVYIYYLCVCSVMSNSWDWSWTLCPTPWTGACQAPLSMEFSRQEYWSGLPFPFLGDLPDPGIEPTSLAFPALAGGFFTTSTTWKALGQSKFVSNSHKRIKKKKAHHF